MPDTNTTLNSLGESQRNNIIDNPTIHDLNDLKTEITEHITDTLTIKGISFPEALSILQKTELSHEEKKIIYKIENSKLPNFNYKDSQGKQLPKEYICIHGSACNDQVLLTGGMKNADFAYSVMSNGAIFQYFDPTLGSAGVGSRACLAGDPMINAKGIGIEFSVPINKKRSDTEEPNSVQVESGQQLTNYLRMTYNIANNHITTSAIVITLPNGILVPGGHSDTSTRNKNLLQEIGVNINITRGIPIIEDIHAWISHLQQQIDLHPNHPLCPKFAQSILFRKSEIQKNKYQLNKQ